MAVHLSKSFSQQWLELDLWNFIYGSFCGGLIGDWPDKISNKHTALTCFCQCRQCFNGFPWYVSQWTTSILLLPADSPLFLRFRTVGAGLGPSTCGSGFGALWWLSVCILRQDVCAPAEHDTPQEEVWRQLLPGVSGLRQALPPPWSLCGPSAEGTFYHGDQERDASGAMW